MPEFTNFPLRSERPHFASKTGKVSRRRVSSRSFTCSASKTSMGCREMTRGRVYQKRRDRIAIPSFLVHQAGLEPATPSVGGWCSIHLSYWCIPCSSIPHFLPLFNPFAKICLVETGNNWKIRAWVSSPTPLFIVLDYFPEGTPISSVALSAAA